MASAFGHLNVLVAVLNVLGLASIMGALAAFFRKSGQIDVRREPSLMIWVGLHLYFHIMLWWRLYGLDVVEGFTFFHYLFLLFGPMCLYFGSLLLLPEPGEDDVVDMPAHLGRVRRKLFLFEAGFWGWAILINPVALGRPPSAWPFWAAMIAIAATLAFTKGRRLTLGLTIAACAVQLAFIFLMAMMLETPAAS